jgi:hypothetical protein
MENTTDIVLGVLSDDIDALGRERMQIVVDNTQEYLNWQTAATYYLGVTGCMRWPRGMRPEAFVGFKPKEIFV